MSERIKFKRRKDKSKIILVHAWTQFYYLIELFVGFEHLDLLLKKLRVEFSQQVVLPTSFYLLLIYQHKLEFSSFDPTNTMKL